MDIRCLCCPNKIKQHRITKSSNRKSKYIPLENSLCCNQQKLHKEMKIDYWQRSEIMTFEAIDFCFGCSTTDLNTPTILLCYALSLPNLQEEKSRYCNIVGIWFWLFPLITKEACFILLRKMQIQTNTSKVCALKYLSKTRYQSWFLVYIKGKPYTTYKK